MLALRHYAILLGVPPGDPAAWALPASYGAAAVTGLAWALILKIRRPGVYAAIGLGADAVTGQLTLAPGTTTVTATPQASHAQDWAGPGIGSCQPARRDRPGERDRRRRRRPAEHARRSYRRRRTGHTRAAWSAPARRIWTHSARSSPTPSTTCRPPDG